MSYTSFLNRKTHLGNSEGFEPLWLPDFLFDFQKYLVEWSNPGETVLTPFAGVGSEVYGAVLNGRRGIGIELKESYYNQSVKHVAQASDARKQSDSQELLFS